MIGVILTIGLGTGIFYKKYNNLMLNSIFYVMYKLIYVFSFLQIKCIKMYNIINPLITVVFVKEGDSICNAYISNKEYKYYKNGKQLLDNFNSEIDLAIVKDIKNGLCLLVNGSEGIEPCIEESKVTFISVTLVYNGEKYKINLKTPEYNFYVIGNRIDKAFIQYYLTNILQIDVDLKEEKNFEYFLEIMDNDVNFVFLNERQYILIKDDKYLLL
jgi:hypothetical protein